MTNVFDFALRQPLPESAFQMNGEVLAAFARANERPDFVKRRGVMVITPETREHTDRLFELFALGIRTGDDPGLQINTWAWLCGTVASALDWHGTEYFDLIVRPLRTPDFVN